MDVIQAWISVARALFLGTSAVGLSAKVDKKYLMHRSQLQHPSVRPKLHTCDYEPSVDDTRLWYGEVGRRGGKGAGGIKVSFVRHLFNAPSLQILQDPSK